jgi:hypothetical protein
MAPTVGAAASHLISFLCLFFFLSLSSALLGVLSGRQRIHSDFWNSSLNEPNGLQLTQMTHFSDYLMTLLQSVKKWKNF